MTQRKKVDLVDTNIILRYLIGDDPSKAAKSRVMMEKVEDGLLEIEIPFLIVAEAIWTLEKFYKVPREEIAEKLLVIFSFRGIKGAEKKIVINALNDYNSMKIDFVDCFLAAKSKEKDVSVYSFDKKDFARLKINRKVP